MAEALKALGGIGMKLGEQAHEKNLNEAKFAHEKEIKKGDREDKEKEHRIGLLTELVKNDQVVKSLLDHKQMNGDDAKQLLGGANQSTAGLVKGDFGSVGTPKVKNPAAEGGIPSEDLGLGRGFTITKKGTKTRTDADRYVEVDDALVKQYPALKGIKGKDISTAQYLGLGRAVEGLNRHKGAMDDKLWARAVDLAKGDLDFVTASMEGDEAAVKAIIERKKRLVQETGGKLGSATEVQGKKAISDHIANFLTSAD